MVVTAHPDDESLGFGGLLAKYGAEGVETHVVCATKGESGRHGGEGPHPGPEALGRIREAELRGAAAALGVRDVRFLGYVDAYLDEADPKEAIDRIAAHIRDVRPQVVATFGPDGVYGHPDHVAISQLTTAAVTLAAAEGEGEGEGPPHRVSKLYYLAESQERLSAYQEAFKKLMVTVDGIVREATSWPAWAITTRIDTLEHWPVVWEAVQCHQTQIGNYRVLAELSPEGHEGLWGGQTLYRVFSTVNGGRQLETDLFEGLR
jgi:LmbE family N-acetylglucosaminyl deacetylase